MLGLDEVEQLLHRPQDPETRDVEGKSALHFAAEEGHLQCVELLLEAGDRGMGSIWWFHF